MRLLYCKFSEVRVRTLLGLKCFHDTYYKMVNTDGKTEYEINGLVFTFILFIIFISIV